VSQARTRQTIFRCTVGGGGHAEQILIESSPDGQVLAVDRDDTALGKRRNA